ncbi:MAG: exodeoxyribonuclease VII large subunit [Coriobacteriia bacterium]|nr:exodeoxyribonuclease VII large subunit [Coriobacteriia bacterium]
MGQPSEGRLISVSEAMRLARQSLERLQVQVIGEVSEFNDKPSYKAAYFTIGDGKASMPCLMWRDRYAASGVTLRQGMQVEVVGNFSAYEPKGRLQFVVGSLTPAGEGRLRMQVDAIAKRLAVEGLMHPARKRPLPAFPERIGLVTSPAGKAVHDVLRTLKRRYPLAEVVFAGVTVEGDTAPAAIARGLEAVVAAAAGLDVVLIVRGGGSYEDLMPFNDEALARAIAASPIPVVTGIGHEPDTTIADMVADCRASTPTAAAEAAAPLAEGVKAALDAKGRALGRALLARVQRVGHRLALLADRPVFRDGNALLGTSTQTLDYLRSKLSVAIPARIERSGELIDARRLRLVQAGGQLVGRHEGALRLQAARLDDLSPLKILARGYAAVFSADGKTVIRRVSQVEVGQCMAVRVSDGIIDCDVTKVRMEE